MNRQNPTAAAVSCILRLGFTCLALLTFASCKEANPKDPSAKVIGVTLLTQQHDFYKDLEKAMRSAAAEMGYEIIIHSAEFDAARQTAQVEDFITQRVDAIVICPCDSSGVGQIIRNANRAKIPVFTADIAAASGDVTAHIASDNVQGGRLAAQTMAKHMPDGGDIVIIDHPEVTSVQDRVRGFLEEIEKHANIKILDRPSALGMRDRAYAIAENMLQAHPDLRGIFAINDDTALGALTAAGDRELVIIGYDATPEAREAIKRGSALKADVVQFPDKIGRMTIETIRDVFAGKSVDKTIPVAVGIVDAESLGGA